MPIERATDHPTVELGGDLITSYTAPSRGSSEAAFYRADVPPGVGLPPYHHDHFDVFTVVVGSGTFQLAEESFELAVDDPAVLPIGVRNYLEAGPGGASIVVAMFPGTKQIRDDGLELVPEWVQ